MTIDPALLDALGLPSSASLVLVADAPFPRQHTAQAAGLRDLAALLLLPHLWSPIDRLQAPVYRQGTFVAVPEEDLLEVVRGTPIAKGGLVGFDTATPTTLRLHDDDGRPMVIDAAGGAVRAYAFPDALDDLPELPAPPPPLPLPDLAGWCAQTGAEPWLSAAVAASARAPSTVERAAAVGLLARLWTEPSEGGTAPPRELARAWARALPPGALDDLETVAVRRAWDLADRIGAVATLPDEDATIEVADLVRARDDLASVRRVLRLGGAGGRLAEALVAVDRAAAVHASALTGRLPSLDDDPDAARWMAVAGQEPDAWWVAA